MSKPYVCESRTESSYAMIDYQHMNKVLTKREELGIKSEWDFSGRGSEVRTYDKIPKHKIFDFLRKAFEECEWFKVKKFKFIDSQKEFSREKGGCYVTSIYWDYEFCGYVLKILYYFINERNEKEYGILAVKDVNCLEPDQFIYDIKNIEILEIKE